MSGKQRRQVQKALQIDFAGMANIAGLASIAFRHLALKAAIAGMQCRQASIVGRQSDILFMASKNCRHSLQPCLAGIGCRHGRHALQA